MCGGRDRERGRASRAALRKASKEARTLHFQVWLTARYQLHKTELSKAAETVTGRWGLRCATALQLMFGCTTGLLWSGTDRIGLGIAEIGRVIGHVIGPATEETRT